MFVQTFANQKTLAKFGRKPGQVVSGSVFSTAEFAGNLSAALTRHDLPNLDLAIAEIVMLCGMSLIQGGTLRRGNDVAPLTLVLADNHLALYATAEFPYKSKSVNAAFVVLSIENKWMDNCNPRAHIKPAGPARVEARAHSVLISGFAPFMVHIERNPPILHDELVKAVEVIGGLSIVDGGLQFRDETNRRVLLAYDGQRLSIDGTRQNFSRNAPCGDAVRRLALHLGACVHDDARAHWYLQGEGFGIPEDGFHSHWIGHAGERCTHKW